MSTDTFLQKISPALASLLSAAAGWALSSDVADHKMTPSQQLEWERSIRHSMRRKSTPEDIQWDGLQKFWEDSSDTYTRKVPVHNAFDIFKVDQIPIPPIMGEVFDAIKHRWTKPENVGKTVVETQGKKRIRGAGVGAHERAVGGHGSGKVRLLESGRRFRAPADKGRIRFHDHKVGKPPTPKSKIQEEKTAGKRR